MKSSTVKLCKSKKKRNYTWKNENNPNSLASNFHITGLYRYD